MEQNPKRTKALIITFIVALGLLIGVYYLFFSSNAPFNTKGDGTARSFFPFLGTSKNKDLNTIQNGEGDPVLNGEQTTDNSVINGGGSTNNTDGQTTIDNGSTSGTNNGDGTTNPDGKANLAQCADGIDNDGNGVLDADDASCHANNNLGDAYLPETTLEFNIPTKNFPLPTTGFIPQCSDKKDNDGDGKIDDKDPGCHTNNDLNKPYDKNRVTEYNIQSTTGKIDACTVSNGNIPGAGGKIQLPTGPIVIPQCSDGIDNNNDGPFDIHDPGCHSDLNPNNSMSYNPQKLLEMVTAPSVPECSDGLDNDNNGFIDTQEPTCFMVPNDPKSYNPMLSPEGNGLSNRTPIPTPSTNTGSNPTPINTTPGGIFGQTPTSGTSTGGTTSGTGNTGSGSGGSVGGSAGSLPGGIFGQTPTSGTSTGGTTSGTGNTGSGSGGSVGGVKIIPQCSDGKDNDGDGLSDFSDPGCHTDRNPNNNGQNGTPNTYDPNINPEFAKKDRQSLFSGLWHNLNTSFSKNKVLSNIVLAVNTPTLQVAGAPLGSLSGTPVLTNPLSNTTGNTLVTSNAINSGVPIQTLGGVQILPLTMFGIYPGQQMPLTPDQLSAYLDSLGANKQVVNSAGNICPETKNNPVISQCSDGKDNDGDKKIDDKDPGCHSDLNARNTKSYTPTKNTEKEVLPQCGDQLDNDKDGAINMADPNCHYDLDSLNPRSFLKTKNSEAGITGKGNGSGNGGMLNYVPQCRDGIDNDGDGFTDKLDIGCHSDLNAKNPASYIGDKTSELDFIPACIDGKDNDGDGLSDFSDPGCHWDLNPARVELCADGKDNDGDKLADKNDPACHTDGDPSNILSYDKDLGVDTYTPYKYNEFNLVPQCRDFDANGNARDNDGDKLANDIDPGCHTDLNAGNNGQNGKINTYDPEKTLELNYIPQCSDGKDNDKDGLSDNKDPGCYINKNVTIAKDYNPEDSNEMEFNWNGDKGAPKKTNPLDCPDTEIKLKFTKSEQDELNRLTREFYALSPNLKNSVDIASEQDKKVQYDKLTKVATDLTAQCVLQKSKPSYEGPKETMRNPYFTTDPTGYYDDADPSYERKDKNNSSTLEAYKYRYTKKVKDENDTDTNDKVLGPADIFWNHQRAFSYHPDESSDIDNSPGWLGKWNDELKTYEGNQKLEPSHRSDFPKRNHYASALVKQQLAGIKCLTDNNLLNTDGRCFNRPLYGLYDMKDIVDKAWREGRSLKKEEIYNNNNNYDNLNYIPNNLEMIVDMYTKPYSHINQKYFCNFHLTTSATGDTLVDHLSPGNHSQIVCPLFNSIKQNLESFEKADIHELKRTIDDYALRLKSGDPHLFYWKEAFPDQTFEGMFEIW